ncbi:uncharacterized protein LOC755633 isoform X2 [Strongylocentrotus purpuratus]|uniref:Uncharacterized protein n=1 Tax=Strongylocentrotus purpuratus TaxID=7668 RepID=A0A7M7SX12_STRPU|nr:uncharacterized protein LOC755633 isoform X2 [Strongylocentrotus purpuratus]
MDGIRRKGKILMGSSDLSLVIFEQKSLHETQSKVLPNQNKVSTALLKWSYTESNANIPNLYSCWSDLDLAIQTLAQESIDHSVEYRKVFKDINLEGKKLNEIQKEKESSAKKVSGIKRQIESAKKSKKGADKVKLSNYEAELILAQSKDTEMGKVLITKTKEHEDHKANLLQESSLTYCDKSLEILDKLRQVIVAKREVASMMTPKPVYNGDQIKGDGISTVEKVFQTLDMQLPAREPALDRRRCFGLGMRSSVLHSASESIPVAQSPKQSKSLPRGAPPTIPGNSPSLRSGHTGTLGGHSSSAVYQGAEELGLSDDSDDDHDYQVPNEEYFGQKKKHDISMDSQEEEYLAPEFAIESPTSPRVPPRQESMQSSQSFDSGPGDYMVVVQDDSEDQPRIPLGLGTSRGSTDSSNSSSSTGPGRPGPIKLPRVLPSSNSVDLVEGEDFCWRDRKSPGLVQKSQELPAKKEKEAVPTEKETALMKRKPQPLPKPAVEVKPKPKPKPRPSPNMSPGMKDKPMPLPRSGSTEQEPHNEDSGGLYEIMSAADAQKIQMSKNGLPTIPSTYDPEEGTNQCGDYYSEVYERDEEGSDSDGDYCVADFHHLKMDDSTAGDQGGQQTTAEKEHKLRAAVNNNRISSEVKDTFTDDEEDDEAIYCNVPS